MRDAAGRLSKECRDLLDHIFDLNEKRRMSIEDIKAHPWFQVKLGAKYENALGTLVRKQIDIDGRVQQGAFKVLISLYSLSRKLSSLLRMLIFDYYQCLLCDIFQAGDDGCCLLGW